MMKQSHGTASRENQTGLGAQRSQDALRGAPSETGKDGLPPQTTVGRRPARLLILCLVLAFPGLQVARFGWFAMNEGGVEHDSGWYYGVARNLAERGIYATSSNIGATSEPCSQSVFYWKTLQDREGFTYFCPGVTVGPGFLLPEALVVKAFGAGPWQFRLLPLTVMFCLLVLLSALAYLRGGTLATILLQVWLWSLPLVTIKFAYEGYAEHLALFYSLLAFCAYARAVEGPPSRRLPWLAVGLLLSLACLTKSLFLISAVAVGLHWLWTLVHHRLGWKRLFATGILMALGFLLPVMLFEGYRYLSIINQFGPEGYRTNVEAAQLVFQSGGSGLGVSLWGCLGLIPEKSVLWENIGLRLVWLAWPLAFVACGLALRPAMAKRAPSHPRWVATVFQVAGLKIVLVLVWFMALTPSTFSRHAWDALMLVMLLSSVGIADALGAVVRDRRAVPRVFSLALVLAAANLAWFDFASADLSPRIRFRRTLQWMTPFHRPLHGLGFAPILPKDLQDQAVAFLRRELRAEDRVYYVHRQKVAELPPLVDKVFFPIQRYQADRPTFRGRAFAVLGPFQIGDWPWRIEESSRIEELLQTYRKQIVFQNDLYVVLEEPFYDLDDLARGRYDAPRTKKPVPPRGEQDRRLLK